jgi:hypothetical protein
MHPLLTALAAWPGRRATESFLEAKGYFLPARYKEIVLANSSNCDEAGLDRYWDEVALEYLGAGGKVASDRRAFAGKTAYRSAYLDALIALPENRDRAQPGFPLDRCLAAFEAKKYVRTADGQDFVSEVREAMEAHKKDEIRRFGIASAGWTGTKGDFRVFLQKMAEERGFILKRKRWRKLFGEHLELRCGIDGGMRITWTFQLPLTFEIVHTAAPDLVFDSWFFDALMPGFHYYRIYRSPEDAILGIQAHLDLFDAIGELILTQPRATG